MPPDVPFRPRLPAAPSVPPGGPPPDGWYVEVVDASPSTNADVAARARAGAAPGLVLVAEHQTAGRGRLDRTWVTPPRAALTCSLLVAPQDVAPARWPWLPLLAGLAVLDAVRTATGDRVDLGASLKWPNDVLARERKLAGVLVELVDTPAGARAVVGVGINVSARRDELPVESATSLALEGVTGPDRDVLLGALLGAFARWYDGWRAAGGRGPRTSYAAACSTLGRQVRVDLPGGATLRGTAVGVDDDGRLLVDDGTTVRALGAGDVVHVRADAG